MNTKLQHIVNNKWSINILLSLYHKNKTGYKKIKNTLRIPNSTLSLRLNELVKYNYLEKFVYGSISKPHYTEYKITELGLNHINNILSIK